MRELILYTLAIAYLVVGGLAIITMIVVAGLWIRHWFYKFFPNYRKKMLQRKRQKLIDKYTGSFDNE
jgi:FtsZ-interacting cell division protein ZipA